MCSSDLSIEFLTVGHYTITMTVSDGTFNISTTQEVVVEANLDNMPVEWTYVDSSWLENVDVSGNTWVTGFNTFFIGDTLLTFSRFSTELKIFEIENNTLSHQKDISIDGEVKNWGNNRLFLVRGTDQSLDAFTGALYIRSEERDRKSVV